LVDTAGNADEYRHKRKAAAAKAAIAALLLSTSRLMVAWEGGREGRVAQVVVLTVDRSRKNVTDIESFMVVSVD
jgi:hypothetical protein